MWALGTKNERQTVSHTFPLLRVEGTEALPIAEFAHVSMLVLTSVERVIHYMDILLSNYE